MERLFERVAGIPNALKVGLVVVVAAMLTAVNYFVAALPALGMPIQDVEARLQVLAREQQRVDQDLVEKQAIANRLNEYRHEKDLLEQRLHDALAELPDDKRIDELLQSLQDKAVKAGLEIQMIEPQGAQPEGFYARIPINMTVEGAYHEIATFLDAIGRLQRIVNVNNIVLEAPRDAKGRLVLTSRFLATTFMFVDPKDAAKPGAKTPPRGAK